MASSSATEPKKRKRPTRERPAFDVYTFLTKVRSQLLEGPNPAEGISPEVVPYREKLQELWYEAESQLEDWAAADGTTEKEREATLKRASTCLERGAALRQASDGVESHTDQLGNTIVCCTPTPGTAESTRLILLCRQGNLERPVQLFEWSAIPPYRSMSTACTRSVDYRHPQLTNPSNRLNMTICWPWSKHPIFPANTISKGDSAWWIS